MTASAVPYEPVRTVRDYFRDYLNTTRTSRQVRSQPPATDPAADPDDVDELELATLSWVHLFNHERLHGYLADVPPTEFEAAFYAAQQTDPTRVVIQ